MALKLPDLVLGTDEKIKNLSDLNSEVTYFRSKEGCIEGSPNHRVVLTTGVFDLVHPGHLSYFEKAKSFGDILVVSVVDDKFVRKGPGRPVFGEDLRLKWLAALEIVDYVVLNGDYGPWKVMQVIQPDVYVKGYNVTPGLMKDIALMRDLKGQTVLIPETMHSTEIFGEIRRLPLSIG